MGPFAAVHSAGWSNYFRFRGRASRAELWWFVLFVVAASLVIDLVDRHVLKTDGFGRRHLLTAAFSVWAFIPSITVLVRRLHDVGWSGHWVWLLLLGLPLLGDFPMMLVIPVWTSFGLPREALTVGDEMILGSLLAALLTVILGLINSHKHDNQYGPVPPHKLPQAPQPHEAAEPPGSRST
ncbi:MAG: DUF805 domain-containing protein [Gammaproteobacteria bacterium AqS3]|nr:DUF805 domain-containing protein [Gammaproteobacteria bacterium AqS3]